MSIVSLNKKERRQLKLKSKKHYEIITELLSLWEELRKEKTPSQQRFQIINEILKISKVSLVSLYTHVLYEIHFKLN